LPAFRAACFFLHDYRGRDSDFPRAAPVELPAWPEGQPVAALGPHLDDRFRRPEGYVAEEAQADLHSVVVAPVAAAVVVWVEPEWVSALGPAVAVSWAEERPARRPGLADRSRSR
jgi:hypothetical protein